MSTTHFVTVSSLALCQRCPRLLYFQKHKKARSAWRVGIEGNGYAYGSLFHKRIARPFFEAASMDGPLCFELAEALRYGSSSNRASELENSLECFVREKFFNPLLEELLSQRGSQNKIIPLASAAASLVRAISAFLSDIPSLRNISDRDLHSIFIRPEQKLKADYYSQGRILNISGCYDALLFNPDNATATIFEFKGYRKSDLAVPMTQGIIYAWLLLQTTGVLPAVTVFHLDEEDSID